MTENLMTAREVKEHLIPHHFTMCQPPLFMSVSDPTISWFHILKLEIIRGASLVKNEPFIDLKGLLLGDTKKQFPKRMSNLHF